MAVIKPFRGFRPVKELVHLIASRPYDVLNSDEARLEAEGNPHSFLHVVKPEIDLPPETDHYANIVYQTGKKNLDELITSGTIFQDDSEVYYIYAQTMWGKTQYGLVGCASVEDYLNNVIRKHELTRPDKEDDRKTHVRVTGFNAEPVFFAYPDNSTIDSIVADVVSGEPEYNFETPDGVKHTLWIIADEQQIRTIEDTFRNSVPCTYVADGHHRTAAAARVGAELKNENPGHTGNEDYNFFLAVHFPAKQLTIIDYNRVVRDLNGLSEEEFVREIEKNFRVKKAGKEIVKPSKLHEMTMYLKGEWYFLEADPCSYNDTDPIDCLDVTVLSKAILDPVLDIKDLRKSTRIDFVGGIRGLGELVRRVDSGEMAVAFALYPVSMDQLITIADTGNIMPPKTTWFEPKLRSGLVLHKL
ncbi:MAG: DUF1015 domain-containing protein [Bacteroidales bacterium]|nr:DUF1015 domain-containing protein [Bacteroidales bacterium]